ncbi:MAG: extracellular solute-binding protein, partial [Pseudomonadota bacterium]
MKSGLTKLAIGTAALVMCASTAATAQEVVIASGGGVFQEGQRKALWDPAGEALGITVIGDTISNWSELRAQADAGAVTWDIISTGLGDSLQAAEAGVIIELPKDIVDRADFVPGTVTDHCIGLISYSTAIGFSTKAFGEDGPKNMVEFWNVEKFPGKRGMYRGADF